MYFNIFQLRDIVDGKKILEKAKKIKHISIIGGGFIGLEIASSLSKFNKKIVVIENAKVIASNNLLSFFIIPPFKRFLKRGLQQDQYIESTVQLLKMA